jgi:D-beta-D-heptose 7-phosphate kinase/D-beta-D-heptose 1-phosphate adenosyltransferase
MELRDAIRDRFRRVRVLVVGDVMLDEYLLGAVNRISPEAPVPVVEIKDRQYVAGGAGNVAANVVSLAAVCRLVALCGNDEAANTLRSALARNRVETAGVVCVEGRPTTRKTRVVAGQQQIVRFDVEERSALDAEAQAELCRQVTSELQHADICILSDYGKGVLLPLVCNTAIAAAKEREVPVLVDPKGLRFEKYRGCTLITPNLGEAARFTGIAMERDEDVMEAGRQLLRALPGSAVLITRGSDGMTLFRENEPAMTIPTVARNVYDVVGAGDTVMAALSVALGAGFDFHISMHLANIAAGIAVEKHGTVTVPLEEVLAHAALGTLADSSAAGTHLYSKT